MKYSVPNVSVIIPVYNVAPYIEKCARSIFEQTLENLEIIFIDDCSLDNSVDIIKRTLTDYPHRQEKTRIIKMPSNRGLASARRHGIIHSTGNYVIHCDGDDWVDPELYERLYEGVTRNNADMAVCDLIDEFPDKSVRRKVTITSDSPYMLIQNWYKHTIHMSCCNKLVKRRIYIDNDVLPHEGVNMWEDNDLMARCFYYSNKIVKIDQVAYHYNRNNTNAITSGYGIKQVEQMIIVANHLSDFFEAQNDARCFQKTVDALKYLARINLITDSFSKYQRFKKTFPECKYIASELDPTAFSKRGRIRFLMVKHGLAPLFILMFKVHNLLKR